MYPLKTMIALPIVLLSLQAVGEDTICRDSSGEFIAPDAGCPKGSRYMRGPNRRIDGNAAAPAQPAPKAVRQERRIILQGDGYLPPGGYEVPAEYQAAAQAEAAAQARAKIEASQKDQLRSLQSRADDVQSQMDKINAKSYRSLTSTDALRDGQRLNALQEEMREIGKMQRAAAYGNTPGFEQRERVADLEDQVAEQNRRIKAQERKLRNANAPKVYNRQGDAVYGSDGSVCNRIGDQWHCNK